ncbi:MAG: hypothetical protein RR657_01545 [Peptostreptococcaceae bacterium]
MKVEELNIVQKAEIIRSMAIEIREDKNDLSMYKAYLMANTELNNLDEIDDKKYKKEINLEF